MKNIFLMLLAACASTPSLLPLRTGAPPDARLTLVWVGRGEAWRMDNGELVRIPQFDYDFSVEQRRYADRWESVKLMRRAHPDYDGSAGPREQVLHFQLGLDGRGGEQVGGGITSSLGSGAWVADAAFRTSTIDLKAAGAMLPFDAYRIVQRYGYEQGTLDETVELLNHGELWVRNHEHATLFAPHTFDAAP